VVAFRTTHACWPKLHRWGEPELITVRSHAP